MKYVLLETTAVGRLVIEFTFGQLEFSYAFQPNLKQYRTTAYKTVFVYRVMCYKLGFNT